MVVTVHTTIFRVVSPCSLVDGTNISDKQTVHPEDRSSEVLPNTFFTYKISMQQPKRLQ